MSQKGWDLKSIPFLLFLQKPTERTCYYESLSCGFILGFSRHKFEITHIWLWHGTVKRELQNQNNKVEIKIILRLSQVLSCVHLVLSVFTEILTFYLFTRLAIATMSQNQALAGHFQGLSSPDRIQFLNQVLVKNILVSHYFGLSQENMILDHNTWVVLAKFFTNHLISLNSMAVMIDY